MDTNELNKKVKRNIEIYRLYYINFPPRPKKGVSGTILCIFLVLP